MILMSENLQLKESSSIAAAAYDRRDLPPLKWSSLKYVLTLEDEINGEEAAYG